MTVERIISGGQTGADRGALDAAIQLGLEHGGWCPRGRRAEDDRIPERYNLREHDSANYPPRTRANIHDADATIVFTMGPSTPGSRLTLRLAYEATKPVQHYDLRLGEDMISAELRLFLAAREHQGEPVRVLNIAGSRESKAPGIQSMVRRVLIRALAIESSG